MNDVVCRLATPEDAEAILKMKLCAEDLQELAAGSGKAPELVLVESFEATPEPWVVTVDGVIVAAYGVAPTAVDGVGAPWFLSTGHMGSFSKAFLKGSREVLKRFQEDHAMLVVVVDSRHETSKRWLRWLGFVQVPETLTFHDPAVPFHLFTKGAANV